MQVLDHAGEVSFSPMLHRYTLEEFWALGLRSPHRTTFDPITKRIWLGDVGQDSYEEIDIIQKMNYKLQEHLINPSK